MILTIVVSNLMYLVGALVAMVLLGLIVFLYHRRPKSVEANMKTFSRGLRALAPEKPLSQTPSAEPLRVVVRPRSPLSGGDQKASEANPG